MSLSTLILLIVALLVLALRRRLPRAPIPEAAKRRVEALFRRPPRRRGPGQGPLLPPVLVLSRLIH